jgi:RNA polymerase sigma-70 factor (ECF subfamily)
MEPLFSELWNAHRRRMLELAFRMLSDLPDAEDVVQEAFARLAQAGDGAIDDPEGWLVVVTSRLCLDRLRTRQRRPQAGSSQLDNRLDARAVEPSEHVTLVDSVTVAMHALLERLSPAERTSFMLHDVFQHSFEEVGTIVGRSPAAARQLASRARRTLRRESSAGRFPVDSALQRRIGERFIEACTDGDLSALLLLLDPAVDGAGDVVPGVLAGAAEVAPGILRYLGPPSSPTLLHVPCGDRIGIVALRDHRVLALVVLTIDADLVVHVDALAGAGPRAAVATALGLG